MAHVTVKPADAVLVQPGAVVSKVLHRDDDMDVTAFAFDAGEGLTEHTTPRPAIVEVLFGRLRFGVDDEEIDAVPGTWIQMDRGTPHTLVAQEPTVMLLILLRA